MNNDTSVSKSEQSTNDISVSKNLRKWNDGKFIKGTNSVI